MLEIKKGGMKMTKGKTIKLTVFFLAITMMLFLNIINAHAIVLTFQQSDGGTFSETDGTYIESTSPDNNYGTYSFLFMATPSDTTAPARKILLGFFDILGNQNGQIGYGSTIHNATLRLNGVSGDDHKIIPLDVAWYEDTITWDNFGSAPGGVEGTDWDPNQATLFSLYGYHYSRYDRWTYVDVTSTLQEWSNGRENYGWIMMSPTDYFAHRGNCIIPSDDYYGPNWDKSWSPLLAVDYSPSPVPEPSSMLLFGSGLLGLLGFRKKKKV